MMLDRRVNEYLDSHRDESVRSLVEFLRIPSIANNSADGSCRKAVDWLRRTLEGLGFTVEELPPRDRPMVLAQRIINPAAPTLLIYNHYDVQPPGELDKWTTPPFEPDVRDGFVYARGASDDKGQLMAHLMALEAWDKTVGLPVNVKMLIEGEEEVGSPHLKDVLEAHASRLAADAAVVSDGGWHDDDTPTITQALRGLVYVEITFHGPTADLHSGIHGGAVVNPINALAACVAAMHDENGRVTLEGFYDDVDEVEPAILRQWESLRFDESQYARELGVDSLAGGEKGLPVLIRRWARPTLDCNGICGGYTGEGSKTVIPSHATAKISTRLVARQDDNKIVESIKRFVASHTPAGIRSTVEVFAHSPAVVLSHNTPAMKTASDAVAEAFGKTPKLIRCGASVPVTGLLQSMGLDVILLDLGLPGDAWHSPNERFSLEQLFGGARASAAMIQNMADMAR
jgi:acetylornithine deacetylase/succinyl-diaminopimelate desuccinylase-like protein